RPMRYSVFRAYGSVAGRAKSPAGADDIVHRPRATLPTQSSGEVGQRGQRRTTVRANNPALPDALLPTLHAVVIDRESTLAVPVCRAYASRYQSLRFQRSLSQPEPGAWSLLD